MHLTMGQIWSIATSHAGARSDYITSELSMYCNLALQEVGNAIKYNGLESTATSSVVSGENRITLPSDFGYPLTLSVQSGSGSPFTLKPTDPQQFDSSSTYGGIPKQFGLFSSWAEVWPSPNTDYVFSLRYVTAVPVMMSSSSTPAIDGKWHMGVAYKTAEHLAAAREDLDAEAYARSRYISFMGSTPSDLAQRQQTRPFSVNPRFFR